MSLKRLGLAAIISASAFLATEVNAQSLLEYEVHLGRRNIGSFIIDSNVLEGTLTIPLAGTIALHFSKDDSLYTEEFTHKKSETFNYHQHNDTLFFDEYTCVPKSRKLQKEFGSREGMRFANNTTPLDLLHKVFWGNINDTTNVVLYSRPYKILTDEAYNHSLETLASDERLFLVTPLPYDTDALGTFYIEDPVELLTKKQGDKNVPQQLKAELIFKYFPWKPIRITATLVNDDPRIADLEYNQKTGMYHETIDKKIDKKD